MTTKDKKLNLLMFLFLLLLSFGQAFSEDLSDDKNDPRYGLPIYSKEKLQTALSKIPAPAKNAIEKSLTPGYLEKLESVEGALHGSDVVLAKVTKNGEERGGDVGDEFVYFLVEVTQKRAKLWKCYPIAYPKESIMVPLFGLVENPDLKANHLDFYVNEDRNNQTATRDYFEFVPGKGPRLVLSCPEVEEEPDSDTETNLKKRYIYERTSKIIPEGNGALRVETQTEQGTLSLDPDPQKASALSTKNMTWHIAEYRWDGLKQRYELSGNLSSKGVDDMERSSIV